MATVLIIFMKVNWPNFKS